MKKRMELCRPCAEELKKSSRKLELVHHGVDKKVFCVECRRRRFGATYEEVTEDA